MARESTTYFGSGIVPSIVGIRSGRDLGNGETTRGYLIGTNVVVVNPEDYVSSPILGCSGISLANGEVSALPTIFNVYSQVGAVHRRAINIYHVGPAPYLLVYNNINVIDQYGWPITAGSSKEFKLMDNVTLYVKASGAETDVRWYEY